MKHVGDITKLNGSELEVVDCITGGSPCQDLSTAGKRAGLAGERSGLFMEQIRVVKEMREHDRNSGRSGRFVRPRYMVWENVPGAFSSNKGRDFAAVLEEIVRIAETEAPDVPVPDKGWPKFGMLYDVDGKWSVAWRVHDAQFWGVPQRRKRIALVADFGGLTAPEILFERKGLSWDPDESEQAGKEVAGGVGDGTAIPIHDKATRCKGGGPTRNGDGAGNGLGIGKPGDPCPTLSTCDRHGVMAFDTTQITSPQNRSRPQYGNQCHTLAAGAHAPAIGETYQAVTGPLMANSHHGSYTGQDAYNDMLVAGTLDASYYKGPGERSGKERTVVVGLDSNKNGYLEMAGTLQAHTSGGSTEFCCDQTRQVRRLTPLECERLQGYPDGWTDIGDWVDSKGKKHKAADPPRYKALGNSIALPFWQWLIKRISAQYERDATMGSLFDGIGGFPYCWERVNGKGSAKWASEIEEFPMAVTKIRFGEE